MSYPLVSVVLPVFNCENYIRESVDSILDQTFTDFELIIVDDGSTDSTTAILQSISDFRVRIYSRTNRGISESLNEGIRLSRGVYVARMDADDIALPERLRLQVMYMQANDHVDILGGQVYTIDEQGMNIGEARKPLSALNVYRYMEYCCPVIHPTYLVKKSVYEALGGYRSLPVEDYDFLLRAKENGFVIENLPNFLLSYRVCDSGLSLANPYATMAATSLIKKMHRARGRNKSDAPFFKILSERLNKPSRWFIFVFNTRARLIQKRLQSKGGIRAYFSIMVVLVSLLHTKVFFSSLSIYIAKLSVECDHS